MNNAQKTKRGRARHFQPESAKPAVDFKLMVTTPTLREQRRGPH